MGQGCIAERIISGHMTKLEVSGVKRIILWYEEEEKYWEE